MVLEEGCRKRGVPLLEKGLDIRPWVSTFGARGCRLHLGRTTGT